MTQRYEFTVGARPSLAVRANAGSVEIVAATDGVIAVAVDHPDRWDVSNVGDAVSVEPVERRGRRSGRLAIEVPPGTRVEFKSASADLRVEGDLGTFVASTASGDLRLHGRCESVRLSTASGDLRCLAVDGDLEAASVSGDLDATEIGGRVEITTTSGDARIGRLGGDASIKSTSGDVRIGRADGNEYSIRTISGDVRIALPSGIRVVPELTTFSGTTRLPEPRRDAGEDAGGPRRVVHLRIKSVSGDIEIQRAEPGRVS